MSNIYAQVEKTKNVSGANITLSTLPNGDTDKLKYDEVGNGTLFEVQPPHLLSSGTWLLYDGEGFADTGSAAPVGITVGTPAVASDGSVSAILSAVSSATVVNWNAGNNYNDSSRVTFNGKTYQPKTGQTVSSNASAKVDSISFDFDNTVTTGINDASIGMTFGTATAGNISSHLLASTAASTYTTFRIQTDGTDGFFQGSATLLNIFGINRLSNPTIAQWITAQVTLINDPDSATFNSGQGADFLQFTASESTNGNVTTMTLTPKAGVTWPHTFTITSENFTPYVNDSVSVVTSNGNDNPTIATSIWEEVYVAPDGAVPTTTTVMADAVLTEAFRQSLNSGITPRIFTSAGAVLTAHARNGVTMGAVTEITQNSTWVAAPAVNSAIAVPQIVYYTELRSITRDSESGLLVAEDNNGDNVAYTSGQKLSIKRNVSYDVNDDQIVFEHTA